MDPRFAFVVESLHSPFEQLIAMTPAGHGRLPRGMPHQGVYMFSEGDRHLYVGRSNHLRRRFGQHCRPSSQHNQAVFAFRLAREATGLTIPAYSTGEDSRAALARDPVFNGAFAAAKTRVRAMDYRCVEITDQTRQALLELYCAIALGCPYNDFNTH
jgi:predicted GIY-YIG superfamily endonuclease